MSEPYENVSTARIRPIECLKEGANLTAGSYWTFVAITTVGILISSAVPLGLLTGAMVCGMFIACRNAERGEPVRFENLFHGFEHFLQSLIVVLLQLAVSVLVLLPVGALVIPLAIAADQSREEAVQVVTGVLAVGLGVIAIALLVIVEALLFFALQLVVDRGMKGSDAVRLSARVAKDHIAGIVGLVLLSSLIAFVTMGFCYFPLIFVLPMLVGALWVGYRRVFPLSAAAS